MSEKIKRHLEAVVISDIHLGTYNCQAKQLCDYLDEIQPDTLILNGDIIDIWSFNKRYFPEHHLKVIHKLLKMATKGTKVYYLLGNHDEALRRYADFDLGPFCIRNKLLLSINKQKVWIFHGDVFDLSIKHTKLLAKLGGKAYDLLILMNKAVNYFLELMGKEKYSLSKKIKNSIKKAVQFIDDFEETAISHGLAKDYDVVICGHIHNPVIRQIDRDGKTITYMNSGDWIEHMTSLEYHHGKWSLHKHEYVPVIKGQKDSLLEKDFKENIRIPKMKELYEDIIFNSGYR